MFAYDISKKTPKNYSDISKGHGYLHTVGNLPYIPTVNAIIFMHLSLSAWWFLQIQLINQY